MQPVSASASKLPTHLKCLSDTKVTCEFGKRKLRNTCCLIRDDKRLNSEQLDQDLVHVTITKALDSYSFSFSLAIAESNRPLLLQPSCLRFRDAVGHKVTCETGNRKLRDT
jgi:hypothetical protein